MRSTVLAGFIALVICNVTHSEATSLRAHQRSARLAMFPPHDMMSMTGGEPGGYHPSPEGHGAAAGMPLSFHNGGGSAMMNSFPGMDGDISGAGQPPSSSHFFG
ncbi:hypothetical protein MRX96_010788 [Rhipicephalus microplus]